MRIGGILRKVSVREAMLMRFAEAGLKGDWRCCTIQPLIVVAGVENPWVRRRKIRLSELVNEPWTWPPPGSKYDSLIDETPLGGPSVMLVQDQPRC